MGEPEKREALPCAWCLKAVSLSSGPTGESSVFLRSSLSSRTKPTGANPLPSAPPPTHPTPSVEKDSLYLLDNRHSDFLHSFPFALPGSNLLFDLPSSHCGLCGTRRESLKGEAAPCAHAQAYKGAILCHENYEFGIGNEDRLAATDALFPVLTDRPTKRGSW